MGQSSSSPETKEVPIEQISHELALTFAEKCYSHLEIAHFRDNFKTLADHQDNIEYWKEETLCRFLSIPNTLHAGPVVYQIATYLGSFPFPNLAPCILTREAMIKIITLLTGRYRKVLKRGDQDKNKLIFRSMAVFDRRASVTSPIIEKTDSSNMAKNETPGETLSKAESHPAAFAVDEPINDEEEEDDDDLVLAALEALDAIEVFQHDQKKEAKIHRAHIPADYLHKLFMLILLFASVTPQDNLGAFSESLESDRRKLLADSATALIAAFDPDPISNGVQYAKFVKCIPISLQYLFRPLGPLFEHFMFSKNIDLSKHKDPNVAVTSGEKRPRTSPIHRSSDNSTPTLLNEVVLAQLSLSLEIATTTALASSSFFHCGARFDELYSIASNGTSMNSFSRQVLSWRGASLFIISGTSDDDVSYVFGAYLPDRWRETTDTHGPADTPTKAVLFQLQPRHAIFHANIYNKSMPPSHFSTKTGISLGCVIPMQSRVQSHFQQPVLGPVSLLVDEDISKATFQHDADAGTGAFCTDPGLEQAQKASAPHIQPKKVSIQIDAVEVWGISFPETGEDEIANQKKRLAWEEAEAARRRGVNFGGDKEGARALLEMAGIVGDNAGSRSGGSV